MKNEKEKDRLVQCDFSNTGMVPESALLSGEITVCHVCTGEIEQPICDDCRKNTIKGELIMDKEERRDYDCNLIIGEVLESDLLSGEVIACPVCTGKVKQSCSSDCQKNTLKEELIMDKEEHREYECNSVTGEVIESELLRGEVIACPVCSREIKHPIREDCLKNNKERR
jgi:hypothetical protein